MDVRGGAGGTGGGTDGGAGSVAPALDRPAGLTESICAEFFARIPCGLQVVAAATLSGRADPALLQGAADLVRARHPVLASRLVHEGGWTFRPAPPGPVPVRTGPPGAAWHDRFGAACEEAVDPSRSLWRVELVDRPADCRAPSVLIVAGHHAALDGMSVATVLRELGTAVLGRDLPPPTAPGPTPPMEDLLPPPRGPADPPAPGRVPEHEAWSVRVAAPVGERRLRCTTRVVAADDLVAVRERARAAGTTVTGVLMAVAADARRTVPALAATTGTVGYNVPADARPRTVPALPSDLVGAYFARTHVTARADDGAGDVWERARWMARAFTDDLPRCLGHRPWSDEEVRLLVDEVARPDRRAFDLSHLLTNIGVVEDAGVLTGLWFTTVQTSGVEAFVVSAATVGGRLFLTVAWPEPLVAAADGEALADALVAGLGRSLP